MVDMHMHTLYSDGDKTVETVLRMCEEKKLEYISITDHNTTKQYGDEALEKNIFTGKIIKGAEMNATFNNKKIEFLAYNIKNLEMINKWSSKFFSYEILKERFERDKNKIIDICDNPCIYKVIIITSGKSGFSCISVAGCNVCIHILFIFRFSSQITSCQISCPAITIIKNFLQIFIAVQYMCYITSTRWGCFLGLETVCNLSIDCEQASKIISKITWIIDRSSFCQCDC